MRQWSDLHEFAQMADGGWNLPLLDGGDVWLTAQVILISQQKQRHEPDYYLLWSNISTRLAPVNFLMSSMLSG